MTLYDFMTPFSALQCKATSATTSARLHTRIAIETIIFKRAVCFKG